EDAYLVNVKEMRNDLSGIGQKVDAHAVSIKQLEEQMNQLSTTVNPRQPGTLPSNTIQNSKNDGHCMAVITQRGKKTIDQPMPSEVEIVVEKDDDEIEVIGESKNATEKEEEITQKLGSDVFIEDRLGVDALSAVMINFEGDCIEDYDELVAALDRFEFRSKPKRLELDMKNRDSPPTKPFIKEAPKLELKALPSHLRYVFLGRDGTLPVIIASDLNAEQVEALVSVLTRAEKPNLQKMYVAKVYGPIGGPWFYPRTVNGVCRPQTLPTRPHPRTVGRVRGFVAPKNLPKFGTTDVDNGTTDHSAHLWFPSETQLFGTSDLWKGPTDRRYPP
uniref:Integrase core domain containing protein n=1 Tax=Solanum tuberosum TaxID=4113 RepID=M1DGD9_SOLTU